MFTNHVRTTRVARGLTLRELAEQADLDFTTIGSIESGRRHGRPETQRAIANALGVPGRDLFPL